MKHRLIPTSLSRGFRRSQRGQSILLLAFAFIALLAFVGLVTDVAMLFVRYAALRRAVDAAAIAAAGQIRETTNYGDIAIAAEQYLSLHNLNPDTILVETCETDIYQWRAGLGPYKDQGPHPEALYPRVTESMPETELCNWDDPHKLVRVSAQIQSPTTFLALIGIHDITLEATSVSETAALDVALVIDTSESMSNETTLADYTQVGVITDYPPPSGQLVIRSNCYTTPDDMASGIDPLSRERWGGCCNDPGTGQVSDGTVKYTNGSIVPNGHIWHDTNGNGILDPALGEEGLASTVAQSSNIYDTTGVGYNFTTLICRPFKDVKDAARLFIKHLDFVRGDRVVLVTFDRSGVAYDPDGTDKPLRPLIRSQQVAIQTLNMKMGVMVNPTGIQNRCGPNFGAQLAWNDWLNSGQVGPQPDLRPNAYETLAACGNTNIGGGILAASNALTDPLDIRREAVWVMVVLSDGAANVTNQTNDSSQPTDYGYWGYCPWWTFCNLNPSAPDHWPECIENDSQTEPAKPICNDNNPNTRYFCLDWSTGEPEVGNTYCSTRYDADDYARDMADFAGLIEVVPKGKQGNFIAMFSIGFGQEVIDEPTAAPLLRYIADAGDNGFIDNNLQQDLREDRNPQPTYNPPSVPYPAYYGDPDVCENVLNPTQQCGQYYYAANLQTLTDVFEEIASRMFTRLSR
jgi:hypothetical protein